VTWKIPESGQVFERRSDGVIVRNIHRVEFMLDVGPTHLPCYVNTSAEMRGGQLTEEQFEQLQQLAAGSMLQPPTPIEFLFANSSR
jgi:phage head maturation protease